MASIPHASEDRIFIAFVVFAMSIKPVLEAIIAFREGNVAAGLLWLGGVVILAGIGLLILVMTQALGADRPGR